MPYCFPRSSIKFQGHTVQNITDFDPNWAFSDNRLVAAFKSLRFALFTDGVINFQVRANYFFFSENLDYELKKITLFENGLLQATL